MEKVPSFRGEYNFLSNFYNIKDNLINYDGDTYLNVESAYHASKLLKENRNAYFTSTAMDAKKINKEYQIQIKHTDIDKLNIMETLLRSKFKHPYLQTKLLATNDLELVERNWWNDTFWGVCKDRGENNLGKILMKIRDELKII